MSFFKRLFGNKSDDDTSSTLPLSQNIVSDIPVLTEEDKLGSNNLIAKSPDPSDTLPLSRNIADGITRPLSPEPLIALRNSHIVFGQSTDTGMVRTNNQDSALSFFFTSKTTDNRPDFGLFIVADGMGGHHDGEKASALTAKTVGAYIINNVFLPMLGGSNDDADRPTLSEQLRAAVQKANSEVIKEVPDGGTTVTAVAVLGDLAHLVHVGDSRAYLLAKDGLERVTRDHSLVERLIELNQLTRDEADEHPQKNVLYRAVGQNDTLEVDTLTRRLPPNSYLLICSDGLWGHVDEEDILSIIKQFPVPQEACDRLISKANSNGGTDNITAILLKVPGR